MNRVILMGRLTRDPEVRYTNGAQPMAVANYTLAVDRRGRQQEGQPSADFIRCSVFGKSAEFAEKYLKKGIKIAVTGRIQTGSYTNREGQTVYTTDVIVDDQEFAESKKASESGGTAAAPAPAPDPAPQGVDNGFINIPDGIDEELPFI